MNADIIPQTGAAVDTLIGLLGFLIGCGYLAYLATQRRRIKEIVLLPEKDRAAAIDGSLRKYKMDVSDMDPKDRAELVGRELRNNLIKLVLAAVVFLASLAMIIYSLSPMPAPSPERQGDTGPNDGNPNEVDPNKAVIKYKKKVIDLRGRIEGRNLALETSQRSEGLQLAELIGAIDESQLGPASRIIKHEYGGWAFLMNVCTFSGPPPPKSISNESRLRYAAKSIAEFDKALAVADEIRHDCGKNQAICEWMMGPSQDINRIHYLKAIALAVIAQAGGGLPRAVNDELSLVSDPYLTIFPAANNPDLLWVSEQRSPVRPAQGS